VVRAFDPVVKHLPAEFNHVHLATTSETAMKGADAAVLCTPWAEFRVLNWAAALGAMRRPLLLDSAAFIEAQVKGVPGVRYVTVGRAG
jgi:UDPglucose 6-dehydrogenase